MDDSVKAIFLKKVDNTKESCMEFDKVVTTLLSNFTHPPNLNFTEGDFKLVGVSLKSAIDFWIKQNHSHESIWAVICLKLGTLLLKSANNLGILNFCKFSKLCGYVIAKSSNTKGDELLSFLDATKSMLIARCQDFGLYDDMQKEQIGKFALYFVQTCVELINSESSQKLERRMYLEYLLCSLGSKILDVVIFSLKPEQKTQFFNFVLESSLHFYQMQYTVIVSDDQTMSKSFANEMEELLQKIMTGYLSHMLCDSFKVLEMLTKLQIAGESSKSSHLSPATYSASQVDSFIGNAISAWSDSFDSSSLPSSGSEQFLFFLCFLQYAVIYNMQSQARVSCIGTKKNMNNEFQRTILHDILDKALNKYIFQNHSFQCKCLASVWILYSTKLDMQYNELQKIFDHHDFTGHGALNVLVTNPIDRDILQKLCSLAIDIDIANTDSNAMNCFPLILKGLHTWISDSCAESSSSSNELKNSFSDVCAKQICNAVQRLVQQGKENFTCVAETCVELVNIVKQSFVWCDENKWNLSSNEFVYKYTSAILSARVIKLDGVRSDKVFDTKLIISFLTSMSNCLQEIWFRHCDICTTGHGSGGETLPLSRGKLSSFIMAISYAAVVISGLGDLFIFGGISGHPLVVSILYLSCKLFDICNSNDSNSGEVSSADIAKLRKRMVSSVVASSSIQSDQFDAVVQLFTSTNNLKTNCNHLAAHNSIEYEVLVGLFEHKSYILPLLEKDHSDKNLKNMCQNLSCLCDSLICGVSETYHELRVILEYQKQMCIPYNATTHTLLTLNSTEYLTQKDRLHNYINTTWCPHQAHAKKGSNSKKTSSTSSSNDRNKAKASTCCAVNYGIAFHAYSLLLSWNLSTRKNNNVGVDLFQEKDKERERDEEENKNNREDGVKGWVKEGFKEGDGGGEGDEELLLKAVVMWTMIMNSETANNLIMDTSLFMFAEDTTQMFYLLLLSGSLSSIEFILEKMSNSSKFKRRLDYSSPSFQDSYLQMLCIYQAFAMYNNIDFSCESILPLGDSNYLSPAFEYLYFLKSTTRNTDDKIDIENQAEKVFQFCRTMKLNTLSCWVAMATARIGLLVVGDLLVALNWCKKCLLVTGNSSSGIQLCTIYPYFESILLHADLHEMSGSLDRSTNYIAMGTSISRCAFGEVLIDIHNLHSLRFWHRMGSAKVSYAASALQSIKKRSKGLIVRDIDFDIPLVQYNNRKLLNEYSRLVGICSDVILGILDGDKRLTTSLEKACAIRYQYSYWGNGLKYVTALPEIYRRQHNEIVSENFSSKTILLSNFNTAKQDRSESKETPVIDRRYFDILRDLRRRKAVNFLQTDSVSSIIPFVLGAASCSVSIDTSLENVSESGKERNKEFMDCVDIITSACDTEYTSTSPQLDLIENMLDSSVDERGGGVLSCFITLEHSKKVLLIGNKFSGCQALVAALPIYDAVCELVLRWNVLLDTNKSQLQNSFPGKASEITERQKEDWWEGRRSLDQNLQQFLVDLENSIGVWRVLFSSESSTKRVWFVDISDIIHVELLTFLRSCDTVSSFDTSNNTCNSIVQNIMTWLRFILCSNCELTTIEKHNIISVVLVAMCEKLSIKCNMSELSGAINRIIGHTEKEKSSDVVDNRVITTSVAPIYPTKDSLEAMKVTDLKQLLKDYKLATVGKKSDFVQRLDAYYSAQAIETKAVNQDEPKDEGSSSSSKESDNESVQYPHIVFIIDETLQKIPWEQIPCLRCRRCSRTPSLSLYLTLLCKYSNKEKARVVPLPNRSKEEKAHNATSSLVNVGKCWYVIDPDSNLAATRETMVHFLQPYIQKWKWEGFVGVKPPEEAVKRCHESSSLFVYCGHGSGEKLFERDSKLKKLHSPASLLWGCSSGVLTRYGVQDPIGTTLLYLQSGAPWVLGNLWDVTDKDIDRLSLQVMEKILSLQGVMGICDALSQSRDACKLKVAVGCSPIVYGIPIGICKL